VRAARVEAIEHARQELLRKRPLIPGFPTDMMNDICEYFARGEIWKIVELVKQGTRAIRTAEKRVRAGLPIWPDTPDAKAADAMKAEENDGSLAYFINALPELLALDRYERRALSRRRRAIEMFDGLRMMSDAARKVVGNSRCGISSKF
jgi:hypothetical protein